MKIDERLILPFSGHLDTEEPIVIEKGNGPYLYDINGRQYLDAFSSLWSTFLGHNHSKITQAIIDQARKVSHTTLYGQAHSPALELTERLLQFVKLPEYYVLYSNSGSEAVESAVKILINFWKRMEGESSKRQKIITFHNSYHGETGGAMTVSGFDSHDEMFPGMTSLKEEAASPVQTQWEQGEKPPIDLPDFETLFDEIEDQLAAVIIEPFYGAGGILFPSEEFLNKIAKKTQSKKIPVVVDEVASGFYRTGERFAFHELDFKPDILILGKALSGGYLPMSATVVSPNIAAEFSRDNQKEPLMHGHTHAGNPIAAAAAIASIKEMEKDDFLNHLHNIINVFKVQVSKIIHPHVAEIRQKGLMAGVELYQPKSNIDWPDFAKKVCYEAKRNGVLLRPLGNIVVLAPPMIISNEEARTITQTLRDAIATMTKK